METAAYEAAAYEEAACEAAAYEEAAYEAAAQEHGEVRSDVPEHHAREDDACLDADQSANLQIQVASDAAVAKRQEGTAVGHSIDVQTAGAERREIVHFARTGAGLKIDHHLYCLYLKTTREARGRLELPRPID